MSRYFDIKLDLEDKILKGKLGEDAFLGTLDDIQAEYKTSLMTAFKAIKLLQDDGTVYTKQGAGIFVRSVESIHERLAEDNGILVLGTHYSGSASPYFSFRNEAMMNYFKKNLMSTHVLPLNTPDQQLRDYLERHCVKGVIVDNLGVAMHKEFFSELSIPYVAFNHPMTIKNHSICWDEKKIFELSFGFFDSLNSKHLCLVIPDYVGERELTPQIEKRFKKIIRYDTVEHLLEGIKVGKEICSGKLPDGILIHDDYIFMGMMMAFQRARIDIPDELKLLVRCDPESRFTNEFGVPCVGCDPVVVGQKTAEVLIDLIKKPSKKPVTHLVEPILKTFNGTKSIDFSGVV